MKLLRAMNYVAPITIFLFASVLGVVGVVTAKPAPKQDMLISEASPDVTLRGVFHAYSDNLKRGEIVIQVRNKKWVFEVLGLNEVGSQKGGRILRSTILISPLRLIGPDKLIKALLETDITGKMYTFLGCIYRLDNIMVLKGLMEIPAKKGT